MTREEAITVFKAFIENPLFSDEHKQAFNIAIHDIRQHHDWDINNLILINKDNYEALEQEPILDKIRAEIKKSSHGKWYVGRLDGKTEEVLLLDEVLQIIDKYKAERNDK